MTPLALALVMAGCPVLAPASDGAARVIHVPTAAALTLNNEGKALYRQDRWKEARDKYQAALKADPEFLAPALNSACALARQDRFAEAAAEAGALVRRAFVPWARETLEAADLAGLHDRAEMATLRDAIAEAGPAWGRSLEDALVFIARSRPPVRLAGEGMLVLGLGQEVHAWLPRTGQFRQVTAEDGRVLAAVRSDDGRTLVYVRGSKLVRASGTAPLLRGLALRWLDLPTMHLGPAVELAGDVAEVDLAPPVGRQVELRVVDGASVARRYRLTNDALVSLPASAPRMAHAVRLTGAGVVEAGRTSGPPSCAFVAADERSPAGSPQVRVTAGQGHLVLPAPFGAGLFGLPFAVER